MDTKFTLSIYDILSHFIPGVVLLLSLNHFFNLAHNMPKEHQLVYLVFFGFVIGVILHSIGILLFKPISDKSFPKQPFLSKVVKVLDTLIKYFPFLKTPRTDQEIKSRLIILIHGKYDIDFTDNPLGLFSFCDTKIAASSFPERDTLIAKEGLFRSLSVLAILEVILFVWKNAFFSLYVTLFVGWLMVELLRYGREYYRTIKNQQIYTLTFQKLKEE